MSAASASSSSIEAVDDSTLQQTISFHRRHTENSGSDSSVAAWTPQKEAPEPVTTDFTVLSDGSMLDLVFGQNRAKNRIELLVWNADKTSVVGQFEYDNCLYAPPVLDQQFLKSLNLRLPSEVKTCPSAGKFFFEVCRLIGSYVDLPCSSMCLVAAFVFSTWFVDKLEVAPYLWICGPSGSGKTTLLRLLHCLCRRSVLIAGSISPETASLPALLRPTLLFDELQFNGSQQSSDLERWLRAGNAKGVRSTLGGRLVDGFGAKVLCSRRPSSDSALASRALHISMIPSMKKLKVFDQGTAQRIADDFQSRLLMFRLQHHREYEPESVVDVSSRNPRIRDMARALLMPFGTARKVRTRLHHHLTEQSKQAIHDKINEPEGRVAIALFDLSHRTEASGVLIGDIAREINESRRASGDTADLTAKRVGLILKSLGIATQKLSSFGRGIQLTQSVNRRIHQLPSSYYLQPSPIDGCVECEELARTRTTDVPEAKGQTAAVNV